MKKVVFVLLLSFMAIYAKGQEAIQLSDLVGKWKLTKVEEVQLQGDTELSRQEYIPAAYSGNIYFDHLEFFSDGKISYGGKNSGELGAGKNIQLYEGSDNVGFHGDILSTFFAFKWLSEPTFFSLAQEKASNQQSQTSTFVYYYYQKE